jgi:hypothetical protein
MAQYPFRHIHLKTTHIENKLSAQMEKLEKK